MALLTTFLFACLLALLPGPPVAGRDALSFAEVADPTLATTTVTAISQGPDGFLWIATPAALHRYDGHDVVAFRTGDAGLVDAAITAFALGERLYAGTRSGGVYAYDQVRREFERLVPHEQVGPGGVTDVAVDAGGAVWIATVSRGVLRYAPIDGTTSEVVHEPTSRPTLSSARATALATDSHGRVFVGTADRGLNVIATAAAGGASGGASGGMITAIRVHRHRIGDESSIPSDRITALLVDTDDRLWVGTAEGYLGIFDPDTSVYRPVRIAAETATGAFTARGPVNALMEDREGKIWAARDGGGVVRIDAGEVRGSAGGNASIRALYEDRFGVIWAGGVGTGLWKHSPITEHFSRHLMNRGETGTPGGHIVWSFAEDARGHVLVGTDRSGLFVFDASERLARPTIDELPHLALPPEARVLDLHGGLRGGLREGAHSVLAALGEGGAIELDGEGSTVWHFPARPEGEAVLSVHADGVRRYLGTTDGSLIAVREDGRLTRYRLNDPGRSSEAVTVIRAADDGGLWIGTDVGSLYRYDTGRDDAVPRRLVAARGRAAAVWAIEPQPGGTAWVAAREAGATLYSADGSVLLQIDPPVDMGASFVYAVASDESADARGPGASGAGIWLTTENGLFRVDARSGDRLRFTKASGLAADAFSAGALLLASDNTIYAGGVNGFTRFDPHAATPVARRAPVIISSVSVPGAPSARWAELIEPGDEPDAPPRLTLPKGTRSFSVTVASLDYSDPSSNRFEHRLIGLESSWTGADTSRTISYTDLRPGEYRLYVRGTTSHGVLDLEAAGLDILVPPAIRRVWFMVALLAALLLGLVALVMSIR